MLLRCRKSRTQAKRVEETATQKPATGTPPARHYTAHTQHAHTQTRHTHITNTHTHTHTHNYTHTHEKHTYTHTHNDSLVPVRVDHVALDPHPLAELPVKLCSQNSAPQNSKSAHRLTQHTQADVTQICSGVAHATRGPGRKYGTSFRGWQQQQQLASHELECRATHLPRSAASPRRPTMPREPT